jgi:hypothetical protein
MADIGDAMAITMADKQYWQQMARAKDYVKLQQDI